MVAGRQEDYLDAHPRPALLAIEVATALSRKTGSRRRLLYAAAGIPEYWIVDLRDRRVDVLTDPEAADGRYRERREARRGETLTLAALPGVCVAVAHLLERPRAAERP